MKELKPQPVCPECEKLASVSDKSNELGHFLDWMFTENDYVLCKWYEDEGEDGQDYYRVHLSNSLINDVLAKFFHIDLDKVEQERRALLEWLRDVQS